MLPLSFSNEEETELCQSSTSLSNISRVFLGEMKLCQSSTSLSNISRVFLKKWGDGQRFNIHFLPNGLRVEKQKYWIVTMV